MSRSAADKLRILVISDRYPPYHTGGYEIACKRTCDLLAQAGHKVQVLTSNWGVTRSLHESDVTRSLSRVPPEGTAAARVAYLVKQLRRAKALRRNTEIAITVARQFSPDIVLAWQSEGIGIGTVIALQKAGYPVLHRRDDEAMADLLERLESDPNIVWRTLRRFLYGVTPHYLKQSDLVVVSTSLQNRHQAAGFDRTRISVVHNGVPKSAITCNGFRPDISGKINLLFAGRVCFNKGAHLAIEALAIARCFSSLCFHLDLVGWVDKRYLEQLRSLVHSLGLDAAVKVLGYHPSAEMWNFYDRYDGLVFPSIVREGFGLSVIEAMARGIPVIAVDRGGPQDIITNGIDGMLFKPEDPASLAQIMIKLFSDSSLLHSIRTRAVRKVHQMFTLEDSVKRIEDCLFEKASSGLVARTEMCVDQ